MSGMKQLPHFVFRLIEKLEKAKIFYRLGRVREDTIMIEVAVPGQRYEIEVFSDESVEVEIFKSDGAIGGREMIEDLLERFSEKE